MSLTHPASSKADVNLLSRNVKISYDFQIGDNKYWVVESFDGNNEICGRGGGGGLSHLPDPSDWGWGRAGLERAGATSSCGPFLFGVAGDGIGGGFLAAGLGASDGGDDHRVADHVERPGPSGGGLCHLFRDVWHCDHAVGGHFLDRFCGHSGLESYRGRCVS